PGLPLLWGLWRWSDRRARERLGSFLGERAAEHVEFDNPRLRQWRRFLLLMCLFWLIVALARPQWGAHEVTVKELGTDIVIALDISNSMLADDILPNRLERAKAELEAFLESLPRGRIGIVLYAGASFVQCPLTLDYGTALLFLRMAATDMISDQGTAIGSALATARELLHAGGGSGDAFQAIVLVTDGEDLEGEWEPELEFCRQDRIVVLPVGVGRETGGLIPLPGVDGDFLKDDQGNPIMTRLDLANLEKMAAATGGSVYRIGATGLAHNRLQDALSRLGERELEERRVSALEERFTWPLGLACACLLIQMLLRPRRRESGALARTSTGLAVLVLASALVTAGPTTAESPLRPPGAAEVEQGVQFYQQENYEQALQAFETARALNPDDPRLTLAVGETLFRLERYDEATMEFRRSLTQADDPALQAESLFNAGTSLLASGDLQQAVELLRRSLALDSDQLDALHNLEIAERQLQQAQQQPQDSEESEDGEQQESADQQQEGQQKGEQDQDSSGEQQQEQQEQQDQQSGQQGQDPQESESEDQEQGQPEEQEPEESDESGEPEPEPEAADEEEAAEPEEMSEEEMSAEEMSRERALSILRALDRDEEELKRSVEKRLRGGKSKSGKQW
ncbi:MAG: VWA domain-containing protein, partial [bacterium]